MSGSLPTNEEGELLGQMLRAKSPTQTLIDSFNHTIAYRIPKIIEGKRLTTNTGKVITFSNPFFTRPMINDKNQNNQSVPLYPRYVRTQMQNYMAKIYVKLTFNETDAYGNLRPIPGQEIEQVLLGKIPVMIGSELDNLYGMTREERARQGEAEMDPQGYFIMHQERVLLNIEKLRVNVPFLYEEKGVYQVRYTSKTLFDRTIVVLQEMKSGIYLSFSGMQPKSKIDIFSIFFALGFKKDTVMNAITVMDSFINDENPERLLRRKKELRQYLQETIASYNKSSMGSNPDVIARVLAEKFQKTALTKSAKQLVEVEELVRKSVFKNITYPPSRAGKSDEQFYNDVNGILYSKIRMLAYMCVKYIEFKNGYRQPDDRDNWANKMVDDAGRHIEVRFNDIFHTVIEAAQKKILKNKVENISNVKMAINTNTLGEQFEKSFTRGLWSNFKTAKPAVVVDILNRDTLLSTPAHLRRINAPINRQAMLKEKRGVHPSSWGFICPATTSEGSACLQYDTLIEMSDGNFRQIGSLQNGDLIMSVNPLTLEKESTMIYNHFTKMASSHGQGLYQISTDYRTIVATGDHPFLTENGWVYAKSLSIQEHKLITVNGTDPIKTIERLTQDVLVADFTTVSDNHSMISNGFITHNCGLVKDAGITTYISLERDDDYIHAAIKSLFLNGIPLAVTPTNFNSLFLNGVHLGYINSKSVQEQLLVWRRTQRIAFDTGIILDEQSDLWISTSGGRLCRPLLIVTTDENGISTPVIDKLRIRGASIKTLMDSGALEYIDAAEQQNSRIFIASVKSKITTANQYMQTALDNAHYSQQSFIAESNKSFRETISEESKVESKPELAIIENEMKKAVAAANMVLAEPKYTHMEIDPTVILGVSSIVIPLPESMPGPRVTYQAGMGKQALGPNSIRNEIRYETTVKQLVTGGVPFTATDAHERFGLDRYPAGMNVVLMVSFMGGTNQEDAIAMNKASVERGLFKHIVFHSYRTVIANDDELKLPENKKSAKYAKLNEKGIIQIGATVVPGDVLVSKFTKDTTDKKNIVMRESSLFAEIGKEGIVDDVIETINTGDEGGILIRIRLREYREPVAGDKFASRYAQKGVIGKLIPEENLPFITSSNPFLAGIRPDIIFNPLGMPSRMTVPKMLEVILGKIVALTGKRINVTAFRKFNMASFMDQLQDLGMNRVGTETFINGETGRQMETMIFSGPVYYQQLRHMVRDKAQARGRGAVQYTNRQPVSGIRKQGALRTGRMEVAAYVEHGAMSLLQDRTSKSSDEYKFNICIPCGTFASAHGTESKIECRLCKSCDKGNFRQINLPYTFYYVTSLAKIAGIKMKFSVAT